MTYAEAAVRAVAAEMAAHEDVVVLGEDVGRCGIFGQYKGLQERFGPQRVIDTPISEAAILGAGVGMALAGLRPVVEMRVVDFALCGMTRSSTRPPRTASWSAARAACPWWCACP